MLSLLIGVYNKVHKLIRPLTRFEPSSPELREIADRVGLGPCDISDYLETIFCEAVARQPRLIVELGVRDGESRFALERAARISQSFLLSVDSDDCSAVCTPNPRWHFVQSDDVQFARTFRDWCIAHEIEPSIDVLFIDTSHLYEHTVQEIKEWFPYLSEGSKVIFHDTNLRRFYRRLDGRIGGAWDNKRGVIQAIEEYLGTRLNERADFVTTVPGWLIRHWSHCNGLTVLERIPQAQCVSPESVPKGYRDPAYLVQPSFER